MIAAIKRMFTRPDIEVADLFGGNAHAVLCEAGNSQTALTYMSVPTEEWYASHKEGMIGISIPEEIESRLPEDLKKKVKCWYFRSDLPRAVLWGNEEAWKEAQIEQPEAGVWCVYFPSFSAGLSSRR